MTRAPAKRKDEKRNEDDAAAANAPVPKGATVLSTEDMPTECVNAIFKSFILHGEFGTARAAAHALCSLGTVSKSWGTLVSSDELWKILMLRCSPAALVAPVRKEDDEAEDEEAADIFSRLAARRAEDEEDESEETSAARRRRSLAIKEFVVSPFTNSVVEGALARETLAVPFRELFKKRMLAAELAGASYGKASSARTVDIGFNSFRMPMYKCTTLAAPGASEPTVPVSSLSFTFELFESDNARTNRESYLADYDEDSDEPTHDFVTEKLRHDFMGPPHFVASQEHTENLVWAATVRGSDTGACAGCPLDEAGKLLHKYSLPVDTYMDDYHSEWCRPWRLVVTATRPDGKMCMIADVRGSSDSPLFEIGGDTCTAEAPFRIVEGGGEAHLNGHLFFGPNLQCGPRLVGEPMTRWQRMDAGLGDEEDDEEGSVHEDEEAADDQGAKRAFETFKESGACESSGALFEVSLDFRRCPRGGHADHPMFGSEENTDPAWIAQRLSTLRWI